MTAEQHAIGNLLDKSTLSSDLPPGKYFAGIGDNRPAIAEERHAADGLHRTSGEKRRGLSSLMPMRSYTPNVKDLDPNDPFQFLREAA